MWCTIAAMAEKRRGGQRVVVYLRVEDGEKLRAQGHDPAVWVKGLVRHALGKLPAAQVPPVPEVEVPDEA
jgi:hypothetical protein